MVLSFLIAGISALLSALCYSEFAAEVSKAMVDVVHPQERITE